MAQARSRGAQGMARRFGLLGWGVMALVGVLVVAVVAGLVLGEGQTVTVERAAPKETDAEEAVAEEPPEAEPLVVHVDGAVKAPGVYEVEPEGRVADAVAAAGGLAQGADTTSLNLAAFLTDGEKIHVPLEGEEAAPDSASDEGGEPDLINLNTADVAELDELPGVGEATALAIVEDREANGPFTSPEDLMRVSGIGEKKYAKLEGMICV